MRPLLNARDHLFEKRSARVVETPSMRPLLNARDHTQTRSQYVPLYALQ